MITIKVTVKETEENHAEVNVVVPKDIKNTTELEKDTGKFIVEKLNEIFEK